MILVLTLADIISVTTFIVILVILTAYWINKKVKQARCKHPYIKETRSCDAICTTCGKNLGFIGTYRKELERHGK